MLPTIPTSPALVLNDCKGFEICADKSSLTHWHSKLEGVSPKGAVSPDGLRNCKEFTIFVFKALFLVTHC